MSMFILVVLAFLVFKSIYIVKEYERGVVFQLGKYSHIATPGINIIIPVIHAIQIVDLRTITVSLEDQQTITKDNVSILLNAVIWYKVENAEKAIISVEDCDESIVEYATTNLRNLIGKHNLDDILSRRDEINLEMKAQINKVVEKWGMSISDIEIKNIELPENIQRAMALEAEAIREKKARLIKATAELEASEKLATAAERIQAVPAALELRRMQMITEVGAEQNSTTIMMIPSEFSNLAAQASKYFANKNENK